MASDTAVQLPDTFDDLQVGILAHDPETGAILDVNRSAEELYGYRADRFREMDVADFTANTAQFSQEKAEQRIHSAAAGDPQVFEWHIERANGELRWVRVHLINTTIDGVECVLAEVRDITDSKSRERRLRLLYRVLRHNLRNEMTLVMGHADYLESNADSEAVKAQVKEIREVAEAVGDLSESIRQIEEITEHDATRRSTVNVAETVRRVIEAAQRNYPDADVTIEERTDSWVNADDGLRYAIEHAVQNAIQHNDRDTPTVTATVTTDDEHVIVRIADDGPAIPQLELEALSLEFQPTSTAHGTGVGLWVMRWCIDSLGGELRFEDNTPRGNVVEFVLPRAEPPNERAAGPNSTPD